MEKKPNLLVVCGKNKKRSRTAEYIFKNDMRFSIRSVGLSPKSERQLKEKDLIWADYILVMEREQRSRISKTYRNVDLPQIEVLEIEDKYEYLDEGLIDLLRQKINSTLRKNYNI